MTVKSKKKIPTKSAPVTRSLEDKMLAVKTAEEIVDDCFMSLHDAQYEVEEAEQALAEIKRQVVPIARALASALTTLQSAVASITG